MTNRRKVKEDVNVTYITLVQQALEALQSLDPVEQAILGLRFGLDDGQEHDLNEVAKHYGVSSEIIRSVEIDALRKLRHHTCYHRKPKQKKLRQGSRPKLYIVGKP